jgi:hypothetical protein
MKEVRPMDDLISKKELLQTTGISYGQLYRWKRKGLIPEDWFIRRSTFTGQETFFPREKILARVERIRDMKDEDISLDAIADTFSPAMVADVALTADELRASGVVSAAALDLFLEGRAETGPLLFGELLSVAALDRLLGEGVIGIDEGKALVETMARGVVATQGREFELVLLRKLGYSAWLLAPAGCDLVFEPAARAVVRLPLAEVAEQLSNTLNRRR